MYYSEKNERGYSWHFFHTSHQWKLSSLVSLLILAISVVFFVWCTRVSNDLGGDSFAGLVFAVGSTVFMIMAAVGFTLKRQARKRAVGELNTSLHWHICFSVIALVMVFLHAFGNYNPRSGTYALYGMIALVICGIIGRILDRMVPRIIAQQARKTLTIRGEDRIESVTRQLHSIAVNQKLKRGDSDQYRFVSSQTNILARPDALYSSAQEHISAIEEVQQALKQETFLRYVIRFWRIFHIALAIVTVCLTLWHVEYALALIFPALQKFGFGYLLPWP